MEGKYLCPGFIDSHLHLESTLVTPSELIGQAVQCGTTTYIVDPMNLPMYQGRRELTIYWNRPRMWRRMCM